MSVRKNKEIVPPELVTYLYIITDLIMILYHYI